jgi:polyisoprenoid-binding protein YceI
MRSLKYSSLILLLLPQQEPPSPGRQVDGVFDRGAHCVAYRTTKRAFFREVTVVGRSCDVSAAIVWDPDGVMARIEVEVPVRSLASGSGRRDRDVRRILDAETHPRIRFRSDPVASEWLRRASGTGEWRLAGTLEVAGRERRAAFELATVRELDHLRIDAVFATTFAALGVVVPRVGPGGIIADPGEDVELLVRLRLDRVEGGARTQAHSGAPAGS